MSEFVMPSLGADMTAGTLIGWLKNIGEQVKRGDIIAEVDTDKGVIEVEVFSDGVIEKLLVDPGAKVPVGTPLAIIREEGEEIVKAPESAPVSGTAAVETVKTLVPEKAGEHIRIHASPVAKKLAEELGIALEKVEGTGPNGRIQREDVERAAEKLKAGTKPPSDATKTAEDRFSGMRRAIAAAMARSKREIPHYYLATTVDFTKALNWLERENSARPLKDRILYSVLLLKAVALALRETSEFNGTWENDALKMNPQINVGMAISLRQGGLVAPALKNTDKQNPDELMKNLRELVARTRAGTLHSSELSDSTITVTNMGEQGVETVFGVIYPPQVALVGFGRIYEGVSVEEGRIKGCFRINASLSADHRASDGHRGGLFLAAIDKYLQEPEKL
jgi:pyruvate dehydrogenase E2 component (dihydrolipoamide acetyltransferase)